MVAGHRCRRSQSSASPQIAGARQRAHVQIEKPRDAFGTPGAKSLWLKGGKCQRTRHRLLEFSPQFNAPPRPSMKLRNGVAEIRNSADRTRGREGQVRSDSEGEEGSENGHLQRPLREGNAGTDNRRQGDSLAENSQKKNKTCGTPSAISYQRLFRFCAQTSRYDPQVLDRSWGFVFGHHGLDWRLAFISEVVPNTDDRFALSP